MSSPLFYSRGEGLLILLFFALLVAAGEVGYRLGRRAGADPSSGTHIGAIQAAVLALLGLLLGFTFSMAVSRFDIRKQLVVDEANAIGTAYLRAKLLPSPAREEVMALLRQYVENRVAAAETRDGEAPAALDRQAAAIQEQLWAQAAAVARAEPRAVVTGLFIQSLNDLIDIKEKRAVALDNHVPTSALLVVAVVGLFAVGLVGYGCGMSSRRVLPGQLILALLTALVLLVIVDLDRPTRGLVRVGQQSMIDLRDSMGAGRATGAPP